MKSYDHQEIEQKWQSAWHEQGAFKTPESVPGDDTAYILDMFPFPSGSGLHVGHLLGYTGSDIVARVARMRGKKVLHPMGWDAFGLPAENYALKTGVHPADSTATNIAEYVRQFKQAGISYDWDKQITTSDPEYYHWTQWLFRFLYERGLAYRKKGFVNWCPKDQTVLANEQVVGGRCERCGSEVVQRELEQWYFKITDYAERLISDLDNVDWPERIKAMQRNWIGKSVGARVSFAIDGHDAQIDVFTTRPDTLYGVTYLVLAPEHSSIDAITTSGQKELVREYREQTARKTELERLHLDKSKTGVDTGAFAIHPLTGEKLPVFTADYVLSSYGTGAIMAVPAHDERDYAFAKAHNLPIKQVVVEQLIQETEPAKYRPSEPTINGESVIVFVKHPTEEKYLGLDWKEKSWGARTLLTGTIEDLSAEETVRKEITEETGYQHINIVSKLGIIGGLFYHLPKATNKNVRGHVYLVHLTDDTRVPIEDHEQQRHDIRWLTPTELKDFLTPETHRYALQWLSDGFTPFTGEGTLVNSGEFDHLPTAEASEKIISALTAVGHGEVVTTYRLRDWLVSRQRYWGAPIPVAYDEAGAAFLIPESELPLLLPHDVAFSPNGTSPLETAEDWKRYTAPDGRVMTREIDTLDGFVCSSWYYLRFPTPHLDTAAFDAEAVKTWLPVTTYVGGAEHAVLHLLYARFITKVLFDAGLVNFTEPFSQLKNQGIILGPDHNKMSKSKGNVINPDDVVREYGADTFRTYEMFMGPFEQEKPWSTTGIVGVRRFLERVWKLQESISTNEPSDSELHAINRAIAKVTADIESFQFNTCISTLMETLNTFSDLKTITKGTYESFILLLNPFAPHLTEEIWSNLGHDDFASLAPWPVADGAYLTSTTWECPVQVNGKVRAKLRVESGIESQALEALVLNAPELKPHLEGKEVRKVIAVPGRLVSIVTS